MSPRRLTDASSSKNAEWQSQKDAVSRRWRAFTGLEKLLAITTFAFFVLVIVQCLWIAVLHYHVSVLSEQLLIQRTRIAQMEQTVKNHDIQLYTAESTMKDIEKKWHNLNFRVLENTWKLDKTFTP